MAFTNEQMERYSRHIILQEVGVKGQKKLLNGKVLIIGAGGLGAPWSRVYNKRLQRYLSRQRY